MPEQSSMVRSFILALMLLVFAAGAGAQGYPVKPIRLIVPYTPGGDTDIVARHNGKKSRPSQTCAWTDNDERGYDSKYE